MWDNILSKRELDRVKLYVNWLYTGYKQSKTGKYKVSFALGEKRIMDATVKVFQDKGYPTRIIPNTNPRRIWVENWVEIG